MKILQNQESLKLVDLGVFQLLMVKLPWFAYKNNKGAITAIDLKGLGATGTSATNAPWLVTCTSTRCSYIFFEGEALSTSYISEKLHIYTPENAKLAANTILELLKVNER